MVGLLDTLGNEFRKRAAGLGGFNEDASRAFEEAAERVETIRNEYLAERLMIMAAAVEFRWNYEALRQKLKGSELLVEGENGRFYVTRRTMLERVGLGRGPRPRKSPSEAVEEERAADPAPELDAKLHAVFARAIGARNAARKD